jgi:hypothetical protein
MMVGKDVSDISVKVPEDAHDTGKHMPTFSAYLTAIVRDSTGRVIRVHRQRSHSPTANFIGLLLPLNWYISTGQAFTLTNATGGTCSYQPNLNENAQCISYPNNRTNYQNYLVMIQVGSGTQSNPYNAHSLASPIANGSGAGQLVYGTTSVSNTATVSGSSAYFVIEQTFSNQTSSTINITEVGIITEVQIISVGDGGPTNCGQLLVWYDTLSSAISVPAGYNVTIAYTFTVNP